MQKSYDLFKRFVWQQKSKKKLWAFLSLDMFLFEIYSFWTFSLWIFLTWIFLCTSSTTKAKIPVTNSSTSFVSITLSIPGWAFGPFPNDKIRREYILLRVTSRQSIYKLYVDFPCLKRKYSVFCRSADHAKAVALIQGSGSMPTLVIQSTTGALPNAGELLA